MNGVNDKFGFAQWGNRTENIYFGCYNNCRYCNVKYSICNRFNKRDINYWYLMSLRRKDYRKNFGRRAGRTLFPTSHDIFSFNKAICFKFIKKLVNPRQDYHNEVLITSKPRIAVFEDFPRYFKDNLDGILVRFTITTLDDKKVKFWEGNSSLIEERINCLAHCYSKGVKTSVSIEPFLDDPDDVPLLVDKIKDFVTDTIWVGHMNKVTTPKKLNEQGADGKTLSEYARIRHNRLPQMLRGIVKELKNQSLIRYKESFLKAKIKKGEKKVNLLDFIPKNQVPHVRVENHHASPNHDHSN